MLGYAMVVAVGMAYWKAHFQTAGAFQLGMLAKHVSTMIACLIVPRFQVISVC